MKIKIPLAAVMLVSSFFCFGQSLSVVTEEWAPFNYSVQGKVTGLSTLLVTKVLEEAGIPYTLRSYPWD